MTESNNLNEGVAYVSPSVKVKSIRAKRMLCQSIQFVASSWAEGEEDWFNED